MHKFYSANKHRFSARLYVKLMQFMQKSLYHSCGILSFFSVISYVTQINRITFISHKTYYTKGQKR